MKNVERELSPAAAPAALVSILAQKLGRILVKGLLASWRAEVVRLVLVVALDLCRLLVDGHFAYRIYSHFFYPPMLLFLVAGGIYFLSSSENEITVTELRAMARPASSGRKVMPKFG